MHQTAVRVLDALRDGVRCIKVVMPEQDQRADKIAGNWRQLEMAEAGSQSCFQFCEGPRSGTRPGPQFRRFTREKESLNLLGQVVVHTGRLEWFRLKPKLVHLLTATASQKVFWAPASPPGTLPPGMNEPEPLQQVRRTYVRYQGRVLSYFAGCDYFRLGSHPQVVTAMAVGLKRYGLNVAASRLTTGNHPLYPVLERQLAQYFQVEAALLTPTGYTANLIAAQGLAGGFSHALLDEKAHVSLADAAQFLDCPVLRFQHRDVKSFEATLARCGRGARPVVLTDGMFSNGGTVAPLRAYRKLLPRDALILVDDAHGAGTVGEHGRGAVEMEGLDPSQMVQCVTLSKAFGVYGGAILGTDKLRQQIMARSRMFLGSTPLPLPLAHAALTAVKILKRDGSLRRRLRENTNFVKSDLRAAGMKLPDAPGPIIPVRLPSANRNAALRRALLKAGIFPSFIRYGCGQTEGYFRFVISSEHSSKQLRQLIEVLKDFVA